MNSITKTILALVAVAATVFGLTVIAQYSLKPSANSNGPNKPGDEEIEVTVRYELRQMRYDPGSQYPAHHRFPGYFEVNESVSVLFWVNNPNPFPVRIGTRGRSCTSCTEASIAVFDSPTSLMDKLGASAAILGGPALVSPDRYNIEAWNRMVADLPADRWQSLNFEKPNALLTIPAANPETGPTWVAIRVKVVIKPGFHIDSEELKTKGITADLAFYSDTAKFPQETKFVVEYIGVPPFDIYPKELKLGDFSESAEKKTAEIIFYSSTQANLPPPVLAADAKDPFFHFGTAERLNEDELQQFIVGLQQFVIRQGGAKVEVKVLAAYRVPVELNRKAGGKELDIGPLDKSFTVTASAGTGANYSVQVPVKSTVTGVVALEGGATAIDLGDYNGRSGTQKVATLVSDKANLNLEAVPELHQPNYLQVQLGEPQREGPRTYWKVTLKIDPDTGLGNLPAGSVAVFRVPSSGQVIRIPVKGHGRLR